MPQALNMPDFWIWGYSSYSNIIIIVTNVIILEFLSAPVAHQGIPQLIMLSFFNTTFFYDYNDVRVFEVFKWTAGCIFKCEATKMKWAKNIKKEFSFKNFFV